MSAYDLLIKGGTVANAADVTRCDVGVRGGRIVALADDLGTDALEVVDARGLLVLPGGIDSHVHLSQPSGPGIVMADDFASGTRSAAMGGNTTVLPFCLREKGQSLRAAVQAYHALAEGRCHVDVSFHLIVTDPTESVLGQELPALVEDGYTSFKVFMTYEDLRLTDFELLQVMEVARATGALVMIHAENHDAIRFLTERLEREGRTAPRHHATSRPIPVEREATHRAIALAEISDVPLMVVHVSNGEALDEIRRARRVGLRVLSETCPQYLTLTEADLDGLNMEGAKYVCSPPPRDAASQIACWQGVEDGSFDVFSSDHCPFRYDSPSGKLSPRGRTSFRWIPNGIPGVAARLPILFSEGVAKGRISLQRFVALSATNHARIYGLHPRKGTIAIGADADIALWDPTRKVTLTHDLLKDGCDYTPYEGMEITGWPVATFVRGRAVMREGELTGAAPQGTYLHRGLSEFAGRRSDADARN